MCIYLQAVRKLSLLYNSRGLFILSIHETMCTYTDRHTYTHASNRHDNATTAMTSDCRVGIKKKARGNYNTGKELRHQSRAVSSYIVSVDAPEQSIVTVFSNIFYFWRFFISLLARTCRLNAFSSKRLFKTSKSNSGWGHWRGPRLLFGVF